MKIFLKCISFFYIIFILVSLTCCKRENDNSQSVYEKSKLHRSEIMNTFKEKFDAFVLEDLLFEGKLTRAQDLLGKKIVVDTLISGVYYEAGLTYLKGKVKLKSSDNVYFKLLCDKNILESYKELKTNSVFLVANIKEIFTAQSLAEADTLSGSIIFQLGKNYILTGECLAVAEAQPLDYL